MSTNDITNYFMPNNLPPPPVRKQKTILPLLNIAPPPGLVVPIVPNVKAKTKEKAKSTKKIQVAAVAQEVPKPPPPPRKKIIPKYVQTNSMPSSSPSANKVSNVTTPPHPLKTKVIQKRNPIPHSSIIYCPKTFDEALELDTTNQKTYSRLEEWFKEQSRFVDDLRSKKKSKLENGCVCILTGPSGIGKTMMTRLLCDKYEWNQSSLTMPTTVFEDDNENTTKRHNQVETFLTLNDTSANIHFPLFQKTILVIDDIPGDFKLSALTMLKVVLQRYKENQSYQHPLVLICNLLDHPSIKEIKSSNVCTTFYGNTLLPDSIMRILKIATPTNLVTNELLQRVANASHGDARFALNQLFFINSLYTSADGNPSVSADVTNETLQMTTSIATTLETMQTDSQRDSSIFQSLRAFWAELHLYHDSEELLNLLKYEPTIVNLNFQYNLLHVMSKYIDFNDDIKFQSLGYSMFSDAFDMFSETNSYFSKFSSGGGGDEDTRDSFVLPSLAILKRQMYDLSKNAYVSFTKFVQSQKYKSYKDRVSNMDVCLPFRTIKKRKHHDDSEELERKKKKKKKEKDEKKEIENNQLMSALNTCF